MVQKHTHMIYKSILLSALLLPVAIYGKSTEMRIKELKEVQFQKELEASNLMKMVTDKMESLSKYKEMALNYLKLLSTDKELANIENSLDQLIKDFEAELKKAKSLKQVFKDGIVHGSSPDDSRVPLLIVVLENRLIERLIIKYEVCVEELIKLNVELDNLNK